MSPGRRDPSALSPERHAAFEERIRQRVIGRCLAAARTALGDGRFDDAEASLAEAAALDPTQPDVRALSAELAERRRQAAARRPRTRWWPVAVAVLAVIAVPTSIERVAPLFAPPGQRPAPGIVPAPEHASDSASAALARAPASAALTHDPPSTVRAQAPASAGVPPLDPAPLPAVDAAPPPETSNEVAPALSADRTNPDVRPTAATPAVAELRVRPTDVVAPLTDPVRPVDDRLLVDRALEQYRVAYGRLDAQLAQAVYPSIDQSALARAFAGLASQSLVFDACDVEIRAGRASATCRGTASYVPKVGNGDPRIENRVWAFTLRRGADDWTIERARASR